MKSHLSLVAALCLGSLAFAAHAHPGRDDSRRSTTGPYSPIASIKVCNSDASCQSPNGPSLNGYTKLFGRSGQTSNIKVCNSDASCQSPNGPSLNGYTKLFGRGGQTSNIKVCNLDNSCQSPNGPSLNGFAEKAR